MWAEISKIVILFLLSSVKYSFAVVGTFGTGWNPFFAFIVTSAGAIGGVYLFTFLGEKIVTYFRKKFPPKPNKPRVTRKNRFLVKLRSSYGLIGIAILTPIIISIPVGCLVALTIEQNRHKIVRYQIISVICWGILLFGLKALFNIDLGKYNGVE